MPAETHVGSPLAERLAGSPKKASQLLDNIADMGDNPGEWPDTQWFPESPANIRAYAFLDLSVNGAITHDDGMSERDAVELSDQAAIVQIGMAERPMLTSSEDRNGP